MYIFRVAIVAVVVLLSSCEIASNAVSSSATGFIDSQTNALSTGSQNAISGAGSSYGTSAGSGY